MFISYALSSEKCIEICQLKEIDNLKKKEFLFVIRTIIRNFLRDRIGKRRMLDFYRKNVAENSFYFRVDNFSQNNIQQLIENYLKKIISEKESLKKRKHFSPLNIEKRIKDSWPTSSFTLKQLIKAHVGKENFVKTLQEESDITKIHQKIRSYKPSQVITKVSQNIEFGSEKNQFESAIVETLQNSIDAANDFLIKKEKSDPTITASIKTRTKTDIATIKYDVEIMDDIDGALNKNHLCLTVRDYVGFPSLAKILTDFILPDYSNKPLSKTTIGDMGNGSFNLYKQSKKVSILTRLIEDPTKVYLLFIKPIKNKKIVEDLELICLDVSEEIPPGFFGTSIRILFKSKNEETTSMDVLYVKDLLEHFLGTTQIDLPGGEKIQLVSNDKNLNTPLVHKKDIIYQFTNQNTGKYIYRLRKQKNPFSPSVITTGGLPFRKFDSFATETMIFPSNLIEKMSTGVILDIALGTYEPVQSRSKVQMKKEDIRNLKDFLLTGYYAFGLENVNESFLDGSFIHFGSKASLDDLRLTKEYDYYFQEELDLFLNEHSENIELYNWDFFMYYKPTWIGKSFFDLIEGGYEEFANFLISEKWQRKGSCYKEIDNILKEDIEELEDLEYIQHIGYIDNGQIINDILEKLREKHNNIVSKYVDDFSNLKNETFKTWEREKRENLDEKGLIEHVIIPWFKEKIPHLELDLNFVPPEKLQTDNERKEILRLKKSWEEKLNDKDFADIASNAKDLLNKMVHTYSLTFIEKVGTPKEYFNRAIFSYQPCNPYHASYAYQSITLNLNKMNVTDFIMALKILFEKNNNALADRDIIQKLFMPEKATATILIHELEHVRTESFSKRCHGHNPSKNPQGKLRNFDICANDYAREAIQAGLLSDWQKRFLLSSKGLIDKLGREKIAMYLQELYDWTSKNIDYEKKHQKKWFFETLKIY